MLKLPFLKINSYFDPETRLTNCNYIDILLSKNPPDWDILSVAMEYLEKDESELYRLEIQEFVESHAIPVTELPKDFDDIIIFLRKNLGIKIAMEFICKTFPQYWESSRSVQRNKNYGFSEAREILTEIYNLSSIEADILIFIYSTTNCRFFNEYTSLFEFKIYIDIISSVLSEKPEVIQSLLLSNSTLRAAGFIKRDYLPPPHFSTSEFLDEVFLGLKKENPNSLLQPIEGNNFPLDSFSVPAEDSNLLINLLSTEQPNHILFYGTPGTGKTEYAKALAVSAGGSAVQFASSSNAEEHNILPFNLMKAGRNLKKGDILIVDEADRILNSENHQSFIEKGWLVNLLESFKTSVIWIVNDSNDIHPAIKRRFTYSREFKPWSSRQRQKLWAKIVAESPIADKISNKDIQSLSKQFPTDAGGISISLDAANSLYSNGKIDQKELRPVLEQILTRHTEIVGGKGLLNKDSNNIGPYNPDLIKTDIEISRLTHVISNHFDQNPKDRIGGLNVLFWGAPGTGKTAYARYLADSMDIPLHIQRASDLMSKYVGDTEKKISELFRDMDSESSIVLLDEADSLLSDRKDSKYTWERSRTNELLTHMENHKGVFICCTNAKDILDPAVLRRFAWKAQFLPMGKDGLYKLFNEYFGFTREESEQWQNRLAGIHGVTPGDFGVIWKRYQFEGIVHPMPLKVIEDLEAEIGYRHTNNTIGFKAG